MERKIGVETTSLSLHIMAMVFMLCDHLWATVVPGNDWLTCVGRVAFPIFAFMIVEGYFHTHNLKKYVTRLLMWAVITEIPFNLVMGSRVFYPIHQNVLWTFLIGILCIFINERAKENGGMARRVLAGGASVVLAFVLGLVGFVDYNYAGVLMVLVFYFFRGRKWWNFLGQALLLWYINVEMLSGYAYEVQLFGEPHFIVRQGFALFALIPIWLYRGKQGPHNKALQFFYYAFYPAHLLVLALVRMV